MKRPALLYQEPGKLKDERTRLMKAYRDLSDLETKKRNRKRAKRDPRRIKK